MKIRKDEQFNMNILIFQSYRGVIVTAYKCKEITLIKSCLRVQLMIRGKEIRMERKKWPHETWG